MRARRKSAWLSTSTRRLSMPEVMSERVKFEVSALEIGGSWVLPKIDQGICAYELEWSGKDWWAMARVCDGDTTSVFWELRRGNVGAFGRHTLADSIRLIELTLERNCRHERVDKYGMRFAAMYGGWSYQTLAVCLDCHYRKCGGGVNWQAHEHAESCDCQHLSISEVTRGDSHDRYAELAWCEGCGDVR